ncbi:hypothetical protein B0H14DRAFT_304606 [Mycena olivaceomarginata]|nr:hypothetical protein B0H14DRAFT_304606 [Mycena olivaceomarginata]
MRCLCAMGYLPALAISASCPRARHLSVWLCTPLGVNDTRLTTPAWPAQWHPRTVAPSKFIVKICEIQLHACAPPGARSNPSDSAVAEGCGGAPPFSGSHVEPPAPQQNHQTKDSTARQRDTACASAYIPG